MIISRRAGIDLMPRTNHQVITTVLYAAEIRSAVVWFHRGLSAIARGISHAPHWAGVGRTVQQRLIQYWQYYYAIGAWGSNTRQRHLSIRLKRGRTPIYCGATSGQQTWPRACEDKHKYRNSFAGENLPANVAARDYADTASFILRSTHTFLSSTQWRTFSVTL